MVRRTPGPIGFPYLVMQIIKQCLLVTLYVVAFQGRVGHLGKKVCSTQPARQ